MLFSAILLSIPLSKCCRLSNAPVLFRKYAFPKSVMQPVIALALRAVCSSKVRDFTNPYEKTADGDTDSDK